MREERSAAETPINVRLTQRDIKTLQFIGEQYTARLDQIRRMLGQQAGAGALTPGMLSESAARVWLNRMKAIGAVEQAMIYYGEPGYVWLTTYGLQIAGLEFKPLKPKLSTLQHHYWCNQVRFFLAERRPGDRWIAERYLRQEQARKIRSNHHAPDVPDAHLVSAETQKPIAIEVELNDKTKMRLKSLFIRRAMEYTTIWYFCGSAARAAVESALKELDPKYQVHFKIYDLPDLH
jgi:hypothetical protein